MNYPIIAVHLLETHGHAVTSVDIATVWLGLPPADWLATTIPGFARVNGVDPAELAELAERTPQVVR